MWLAGIISRKYQTWKDHYQVKLLRAMLSQEMYISLPGDLLLTFHPSAMIVSNVYGDVPTQRNHKHKK